MKIAVCVSGHISNKPDRVSVDDFIDSFEIMFAKKHSVDYFIALSYDAENVIFYNKIIDRFKPKVIVDLNKYTPPRNKDYPITRDGISVYNSIKMFWKIWVCNEAKKQYEVSAGFKYSLVIRTRPDLYFSKTLSIVDLFKLKTGFIKIWVSYFPWAINDYAVSDFFAIGKSKYMDYYSQIYLNMDSLYNNGIVFHPESLLGAHLQIRYKIFPRKTICYLNKSVMNSNGYPYKL
jgi:hypothetical protein